MTDPRKDTPAFHRNIKPITGILRKELPQTDGRVLETGSGSGQHITSFAGEFPYLTFQPSDYAADNLPGIDAWTEYLKCKNVEPAIQIDLAAENWFAQHAGPFSSILCFNVIHISPWAVTCGLFAGASRYLAQDGKVILYGPYRVDGEHTAPSNAEFENWLKEQNGEWGVRDIKEVEREAEEHGFKPAAFHSVPANNFMPVFVRA